MSGPLTHLLDAATAPLKALLGDHPHGHDGPLGLGHEADGHGHGIDQRNDGSSSGRNDVGFGHDGNGHGDHADYGNGPAYGRNDGGGQNRSADLPGPPVPGSGATPGGLPGSQGSNALPGFPGSASGSPSLPGGLPVPGNPLGGLSSPASPSLPSSPLSTVLDLPLAQLASLTTGLQTIVQQVLGAQPLSTPEIPQGARPETVSPRTAESVFPQGQNIGLPGQPGLAGDRTGAVPLTQVANASAAQTLSQGLPVAPTPTSPGASQAVLSSAASAPASQAATAAPTSPGQLVSGATTALPQQVASLPPGRLDAATVNAQFARNDVAFLPGSTPLSPPSASLVQARADVVPPTMPPQIAGSTLLPGAQMAQQPGQLQSGFVRPGLDGVPIGPKDGLTGPLAGHTAEGVRRRGYGLDGRRLPGLLSWLSPSKSLPLDHPLSDDAELRAVDRAYTWLFWVLALVGYASLAFAIVALVPPGSGGLFDESGTQLTGGGIAAIGGLFAIVTAWLVIRKSRRV